MYQNKFIHLEKSDVYTYNYDPKIMHDSQRIYAYMWSECGTIL